MNIADVVRTLVKLEDQQVICVLTRHDETEDAQRNQLDAESPVVRMIGRLGYLGSDIYKIVDGKNEMYFNCRMVEHVRPATVIVPATVYLSWLE